MPIIPLDPKTTLHNKRYLIVRIIGYGGFGNTYLAFDRTLDNHCVVKEFALDMICTRDSTNATIVILHKREGEMAKWLDKFTEEARHLARIRHFGVVNAFDIWREKGTAFYAMEHIEGGELPDPAKETWKPMTWSEAKKLAIAILEALKAVHEVGLLHGDIKPANILVDKKTKQPILIDFGTARSLKKAQDKTVTSLAYTAGYAPIELQDRKRSKETNPSSDLYSWAMVVIGLVAKHHDDGWPIDAKTRIVADEFNGDKYNKKFLHKWLANSLPTSVISILADCLQLNSNQRPQSASVILDQLENSERNPVYPRKPVEQNPVYPQKPSSLNSRTQNEKTVLEQDDNKIVQEQNYKNIHLKQEQEQNKGNFRAKKINEKTKTNQIIMFVLIVGIIGIGFFFVKTNSNSTVSNSTVSNFAICGTDANLINGECVPREASMMAPEGFLWIPAGSFMMGSPSNESGRQDNETQHEVTITHPFYMQRHEVTQGEWQALMGNNPSHFNSCGANCPIEMVNWWEALDYANTLSNSEGLRECYVFSGCRNDDMECSNVSLNSNCGYRLPTEAEWEYAARAGTRTAFYNDEQTPNDIAWYSYNSNRRTHPVGEKAPNSWGLYDMSGNVLEWCWDRYGSYGSSSVTDPMGANSGSYRMWRGGSWLNSASTARSAHRGNRDPGNRFRNLGFRLVSSAL